ncbi:MAG: type II toxin-antitoxin system RelB/DinJ family antitoxin [Patescibacteria group bacterium]
MATKSVQVRLDADLKKRVEHVLNEIGVDVPTAVRIFFTKVAATGGIPFLLQTEEEDHYTPIQLRAFDRLAAEARNEKLSGPFSTVEELLADLNK